jgi:hypothetical protein
MKRWNPEHNILATDIFSTGNACSFFPFSFLFSLRCVFCGSGVWEFCVCEDELNAWVVVLGLTLLRWRKSKLGRSCGKRVAII